MDIIDYKRWFCAVFSIVFCIMTACGKNPTLLTQKMLNEAGTCFVIKGEYTADGAILQLADQQELSFENGKIDNAILVGNHSFLKVKSNNPVFGKNVQIKGVWDVDEVHDGWFEYEEGRGFIANQLIKNMLAFSNDATFCHLYFEEDRTYYFELPYHGNASLGDEFSYHINDDGKKKRHYREVYNDEYSFLRIFTIPSNTTLTIDNTLQMLPTNMGAYFVFWEYGKENVTIEGSGIIAGENKDHLYTTPYAGKSYYGEWGFLFRCFKCKKFVFRDITLQDSFGDCIGFSGSTYPNEHGLRCADGLLVENVKIIGARRNGISLSARNVIIRNCHFEDCGIEKVKGTSPRCAIDFESSSVKRYPENGNENVLMENCTFKNNSRDVSTHRNNRKDYGRIATTIKNCIFTDKVKLGNSYWMRFENCYFSFLYNKDDIRSVLLNSHFMEFVNCEFGQWDAKIPKTKTKSNNSFINCKFNK